MTNKAKWNNNLGMKGESAIFFKSLLYVDTGNCERL